MRRSRTSASVSLRWVRTNRRTASRSLLEADAQDRGADADGTAQRRGEEYQAVERYEVGISAVDRRDTPTYRAVQNGATTLAEGFLFLVGASLVLGESYRSSRSAAKRRDDVADRLESLEEEIGTLRATLGDDGDLSQSLAEVRQQ
jgi:hypothetical protein